MTVHDDIVIEVDEDKVDDTKAWLQKCMVDGMRDMIKEVPVAVDVEVRQTL